MKLWTLYLFIGCCLLALPLPAQPKINVLYLTGHSDRHHSWEEAIKYHLPLLKEAGIFHVEMVENAGQGEEVIRLTPYDVVVLNVNEVEWSKKQKRELEKFIRKGGGLVVMHEADNAFPEWKEFNRMIGLGGWGDRNEQDGPFVYWKDGKFVKDHITPGSAGKHGRRVPYVVTLRSPQHPIVQGMPTQWLHVNDELYGNLRGPAENMEILATAFSEEATGGTGKEEPVAFTVKYGKGRVFHCVLGHTKKGNNEALKNLGYQLLFIRGTEWAATGEVTTELPDNLSLSTDKPTLRPFIITVHTIGDSTMADYAENTTRTRGWGEMLQEFFTSDVKVANYARGGRSSRSFYKEGRWKTVTDSLRSGDYVLIQFAHNDEKEGGKDGKDGRGTAPWSTYKSYLEKYVDETRALGGKPVLITPIIRRYFTSKGTISARGCHDLGKNSDDSTLNYVRVMKHVAREKQVPLIDMTAMTRDYAEALGAEQTIRCIYVPTDGTHTQATGAAIYAKLAVEGLKAQGILAEDIRPDIPLVLNPTQLDFKSIFVGEEAVTCFDLTGINLPQNEGVLTLEAPTGMSLSETPHEKGARHIEAPFHNGKLWNRCYYLHFTPSKSGIVKDAIKIQFGKTKRLLPVKAEVKEIRKRKRITLYPESPTLHRLRNDSLGITLGKEKQASEIDEDPKRYVEVILPPSEQTRLCRTLTLTLEGNTAYRIACAYGKDFYPRTDLGEATQSTNGMQQISLPMNVTLNPGQQLHIRLFPWQPQENEVLHFNVKNWKIEGVVLE